MITTQKNKRCPNGTRKDQKTGKCEPKKSLKKNVVPLPPLSPPPPKKIASKQKEQSRSSYERLFFTGDNSEQAKKIGNMFTKIHSKSIKSGNNLEKFINEYVGNESSYKLVTEKREYFSQPSNLDKLFKTGGDLIISKCFVPLKYFNEFSISCTNKTGVEIDYAIVKDSKITFIEMKAGKDFDTKKSSGEVASLMKVKNIFTMLGYTVETLAFVSYEALTASDINLKTDLKDCTKLNFKSFLNIFLQPKEVTDGIEYIKTKFQKDGEDNIRILKKEILNFYETL
jgi:hypothetical protein